MGSTVPDDLLLEEILTRTSPDTVARMRSVCKQWNQATQQWTFADKFHRRTNTVSAFLLQNLNKNKFRSTFFPTDMAEGTAGELSLAFVPGRIVKIEAATKQGLILCLREASARPWVDYLVCKPTTKQWTEIPKPRTRYFTRKIAMAVLSSNPSKLRYKIVRFSEPKEVCVWHKSVLYATLGCEVFDSETWAWRCLPEKIRLPVDEIVLFNQPVVSAGGFFYAPTTKMRVFAFDWSQESWDAVALPAALSDAETHEVKIVECGGKLGLIFSRDSSESVELWVFEYMAEHGARAWNMRKRVDVSCLNKGNLHSSTALAMSCSDVIVFRALFAIKLFRFGSCDSSKNQVLKVVKTSGVCDHLDELFRFESDDEFVDIKMAKKKSTVKRSKSLESSSESAITTTVSDHPEEGATICCKG